MPFAIARAVINTSKNILFGGHRDRQTCASSPSSRVPPPMTVIARPTARRNAKARSSVRQCKASQFEDHADKWSEYRRHLMLPTPVVEANQAQQDAIRSMYSVLVAAIHSTDDLRLLQSTLQTRMQEATKMQVFQLWPFLTGSTNIATILYNVTDIVHAAYHLQRTETTPPVLYQLMQHVVQIHPDCNPLQSPTLMSTLKLIAEIHDQPTMSSHTEATVISILSLWGFSPMQVFGRQGRSIYTVWRSTALPDAEAFAFLPCQQLLQQQRYSLSDCSPSASMQLSGAAEGNHTMPAELTSSLQPIRGLLCSMDEEDGLVQFGDRSHAANDGDSTPTSNPQELKPGVQLWMDAQDNTIPCRLDNDPHRHEDIEAYLKRHSNVYVFDWGLSHMTDTEDDPYL